MLAPSFSSATRGRRMPRCRRSRSSSSTEARDALLAAEDTARGGRGRDPDQRDLLAPGQPRRGVRESDAARALIADQPNSYSKAYVVANVSRYATLAGEHEDGISVGREALAMARGTRIDPLRSHALNNIGIARVATGDMDGHRRPGAERRDRVGSQLDRERSGVRQSRVGALRPRRAGAGLGSRGRGASSRRAFGVADWLRWIGATGAGVSTTRAAGMRWSRQLDGYVAEAAESGFWMETSFARARGQIRLARGDLRGAQEDADRALERAEAAKDPQVAVAVAGASSRAPSLEPTVAAPSALLPSSSPSGRAMVSGSASDCGWLPDLAVALVALGGTSELPALIERSRVKTPWRRAAAAYVSGDFGIAADTYSAIGALPEEAQGRLRAAETFVAGRPPGRGGRGAPALARLLALRRRDGLHARGRGAPGRGRLVVEASREVERRDLEARVEVEPVRVGAGRAHARVEVELLTPEPFGLVAQPVE